MAWLGAELDRARRWGALWKRAAKDGARDWRDLVAAYEDMRAENTTVRRAARARSGVLCSFLASEGGNGGADMSKRDCDFIKPKYDTVVGPVI